MFACPSSSYLQSHKECVLFILYEELFPNDLIFLKEIKMGQWGGHLPCITGEKIWENQLPWRLTHSLMNWGRKNCPVLKRPVRFLTIHCCLCLFLYFTQQWEMNSVIPAGSPRTGLFYLIGINSCSLIFCGYNLPIPMLWYRVGAEHRAFAIAAPITAELCSCWVHTGQRGSRGAWFTSPPNITGKKKTETNACCTGLLPLNSANFMILFGCPFPSKS